MNKRNVTRFIVGNALLIALTVVFSLINIPIVPGVSLNLSLVTIALVAIIYGWKSGLVVGAVNGALMIISAGVFLAENPVATVFVCILKTGLAGVVSALLFKVIRFIVPFFYDIFILLHVFVFFKNSFL